MRNNRLAVIGLVFFLIFLLGGCSGAAKTANQSSVNVSDLILATTTSTQDTGLLDDLIPAFEKSFPYRVKTIAVGSGEALAMGERGEADVLLVHSPAAEKKFMSDGHGQSRRPVMYNMFILVGPKDDGAAAGGAENISAALRNIGATGALFISRGDESGTHVKELALWKAVEVKPSGDWYIESGLGMGETLRIADQKNAYALSDEGTFLSLKSTLSLKILRSDDKDLENPYSVITVSSKKHPKINVEGAKAFASFITGPRGQSIINGFGVEDYGKRLFTPVAE